MNLDKKLSMVLNALLRMALIDRPITSEALAEQMKCNASVLRRTLAYLKELELVDSSKGYGGGWILAKRPDRISALDIYHAIGSPRMFAIGNPIQDRMKQDEEDKVIARFMFESLDVAEQTFLDKLETVSLGDLQRLTQTAIKSKTHVTTIAT